MAGPNQKKQERGNRESGNRLNRQKSLSWQGWADRWDQFLFLLLGLSLAVVPLCIRIKTDLFLAPKYTIGPLASGMQGDAFSYYKFVLLCILASAALIAVGAKIGFSGYRIEKDRLHFPLLFLIGLFLLSLLAADYQNISLYGLYNRREGTLTYLCFLILMFAFSQLPYREKIFSLVKGCLSVVIISNTIVCFSFYALNYDLGKVGWIRSIIQPDGMIGHAEISLPSLLENVNYSSGFHAAACAFFLAVSLLTLDRTRKIFPTLMASFAFFGILAAVSMSGILTLLLLLPMLSIWALLKLPRRQALSGLCLNLSLFMAVFCGSILVNEHIYQEISAFFQKVSRLGKTTSAPAVDLHPSQPWTRPGYPDLSPTSRSTSVLFAAGRKWPSIEPHLATAVTNQKASAPVIPVSQTSGATPSLPPAAVQPAAEKRTAIEQAREELSLPPQTDGLDPVRIYIWKHTLSLIAQRPLLGYGMDTLAYYIPQYTKERYIAMGLRNYPSKPHNFYLSIAFGAGIPTLAILLILLFNHLWSVLRALIQSPAHTPAIFQVALCAFFLSYLIQWMVNDSTIAVSILFWSLLGVSLSLHREFSMDSRAARND